MGEDGLEVAFEEGAGVLEVLLGVGFGGGEALKRFVQQADDPLLVGQRRDGNLLRSHIAIRDRRIARALLKAFHLSDEVFGEERVEDEAVVDSLLWSENEITRAANLPVEMFWDDGDSLERGANGREDDVIRSDELSRSAWRVLSFETLSFLNLKGSVGNAGHVDVVELSVRGKERINRLGLFKNFTQRLRFPPLPHSTPLLLPSTSALSASSAAISFMMSCGLRCAISSPPLGFFTERSTSAGLSDRTSTFQLFGVTGPSSAEALEACNAMNSARSASLSGLVLPMLRPGSSW